MNELRITADQLAIVIQQAIATYPEECCGLMIGSRSLDAASTVITVQSIHSTRNAWSDEQDATLDAALAETLPAAISTHTHDSDPKLHSRRDRFWIDPADLFAAMKSSRDRGLEIVGVYHSHPNHAAIPSATDLQLAWPEYAYLIISVRSDQITEHRCWQLDQAMAFAAMTVSITATPTNVTVAPPTLAANPVE
jgi:proteasome lid subunit RPN8/RPN11